MCLTAGQVFTADWLDSFLQPEKKSQRPCRTQQRLTSITEQTLGLYSRAAADIHTRKLPVLLSDGHHTDTHHTTHQESIHWQRDGISSDDTQYQPPMFHCFVFSAKVASFFLRRCVSSSSFVCSHSCCLHRFCHSFMHSCFAEKMVLQWLCEFISLRHKRTLVALNHSNSN